MSFLLTPSLWSGCLDYGRGLCIGTLLTLWVCCNNPPLQRGKGVDILLKVFSSYLFLSIYRLTANWPLLPVTVGTELMLYPLRFASATLRHDPRLCSPQLLEALRRLRVPLLREDLCAEWWAMNNSSASSDAVLPTPHSFSALDVLEVCHVIIARSTRTRTQKHTCTHTYMRTD